MWYCIGLSYHTQANNNVLNSLYIFFLYEAESVEDICL